MNVDQFERELERHRSDRPEQGQSDDAVARNSSMALLSRIDHLLNQFDEVPVGKKKYRMLGTARNILIECIDYTTGQFGSESVEHLLPQVCTIRDTLHSLEKELSGFAWVRALIVSSTQWDYVDRDYQRVGSEICEVCSELLEAVDEVFQQPTTVEQWKSSREIVMNELRRRW